jgi:hypothetical protein
MLRLRCRTSFGNEVHTANADEHGKLQRQVVAARRECMYKVYSNTPHRNYLLEVTN